MDVGEFDYALPAELIAQHPPPERDASRLLVVDRDGGDVRHRSFRDVPACLRPADVLVLNDTRVLPARIVGRRSTGGAVEALVLSASAEGQWRLLIKPAGRLKPGEDLNFEGGAIRLRLVRRNEDGHWLAAGDLESAAAAIQRVGRAPLPPYIRRPLGGGGRSQVDPYRDEDRRRYQTVFARHDGAIAAPTAGTTEYTRSATRFRRQRRSDALPRVERAVVSSPSAPRAPGRSRRSGSDTVTSRPTPARPISPFTRRSRSTRWMRS